MAHMNKMITVHVTRYLTQVSEYLTEEVMGFESVQAQIFFHNRLSCAKSCKNVFSIQNEQCLLTQLLRGANAGILRHRSRMTRIMMTHDCKLFAFACGK